MNFAKSFQVFAKSNLTTDEEDFAADSNSSRGIGGFFSAINIFATRNLALRWSFAALGLILIAASGFWIANKNLNKSEGETQAKREVPVQNQPNKIPSENPTPEIEKEVAKTDEKIAQPEQTSRKEQSPKPQLPTEKQLPKPEQPPVKSIVAFFVLAPPLRDAGQIKNLSIPKRTDKIAMQLQLEFADYTIYRVALVNQSGSKNLWTSGKLKTKSEGENKALDVRFPARLLKSQTYSLVVSGINSNGESEIISNYPFRAVIK